MTPLAVQMEIVKAAHLAATKAVQMADGMVRLTVELSDYLSVVRKDPKLAIHSVETTET